MVSLGKPEVLVTYTRDCLFRVMKSKRSQEVKSRIHESDVDQRKVPPHSIFHERIDEQDDLGHNERPYQVLGWL